MTLTWGRENPPVWDEPKRRIVGGAPPGLFATLRASADGLLLPGDWWRVDEAGVAVGYGWMDVTPSQVPEWVLPPLEEKLQRLATPL